MEEQGRRHCRSNNVGWTNWTIWGGMCGCPVPSLARGCACFPEKTNFSLWNGVFGAFRASWCGDCLNETARWLNARNETASNGHFGVTDCAGNWNGVQITNMKSTIRFPSSHRWTPKFPKGGSRQELLHSVLPFIFSLQLMVDTSNLACGLNIAGPSLQMTNHPWNGRGYCYVTSLTFGK